MPFDGGDLSRALGSQPVAQGPTNVRVPLWARVWDVLVGGSTGRDARPRSPAQPRWCPAERPAVRLLRSARALIEAEGAWVQGTYGTPDGRHCAVGALRVAAAGSKGRPGRCSRREAHRALVAAARGRGCESVEIMNDKATHAQVLAAFDEAVAGAGRRGLVAGT